MSDTVYLFHMQEWEIENTVQVCISYFQSRAHEGQNEQLQVYRIGKELLIDKERNDTQY